MMNYGLQMYSVRDITRDDLPGAVAKVAQMGYKLIEFAGFFGIPACEIKAMLEKYSLRVSGTHTGWQELAADRLAETIAYHKEIGNTNIIIPGGDFTILPGDKVKVELSMYDLTRGRITWRAKN